MVMLFTVILLTTFLMTPRADALRVRVVKALDLAGISRKEAAITMKLTEQRLSEALNGKSPLSVFRLADLPDAFWDAFDALGVEERGGVVISSRLAQLVRGLDQLVMAKVMDVERYLERTRETA
jgi:hypothetical protein